MVHASFSHTKNALSLTITGHAHFAPHGEDIVCAACSILGHSLLCSLASLKELKTAAEAEDGLLSICAEPHPAAHAMFLMVWAGFQSLAQHYPKNVCVRGEIRQWG